MIKLEVIMPLVEARRLGLPSIVLFIYLFVIYFTILFQ
jgi:hypothetical protein